MVSKWATTFADLSSWKRNDLVISTKIYWGQAFGDNPINNVGLSRKHIVEGLNQSLARLQLDYGRATFPKAQSLANFAKLILSTHIVPTETRQWRKLFVPSTM